MPGVIRKTENLVTAIQQSKEYLSYSELRKYIVQETELSKPLDAFRRQVFWLQNSENTSEAQAGIEKLQAEYKDILSHPKVLEYLAAEKAFTDMMKDIYARIGNAVTFDLSFLEE